MRPIIIPSLLWTDLYIFTMAQAILHQCSGAMAKFEFVCRSENSMPPGREHEFISRLQSEIYHFCDRRLSKDELEYLSKIPFFKPDFIEYLRQLQLNPKHVQICKASPISLNGGLKISITGPWLSIIWFEVPLLAMCSQIYNEMTSDNRVRHVVGLVRLQDKTDLLLKTSIALSDFGTRRSWSTEWHEEVIQYMSKRLNKRIGTSNVYLAKKYGLEPIGTMAHQWIQAWQQLGPRLEDFQKVALQKWADEYRGDLGIALTDTIGIDAFLRDFDPYFAKLYDGVRHDSGDPLEWAQKVVIHYNSLGIDSRTKKLVFSDGLTIEKAIEIEERITMSGEAGNIAFGIGGNLVQDMGVPPYQAVIKLTEINGRPVAKISDAPGKTICNDPSFLSCLKKTFQV